MKKRTIAIVYPRPFIGGSTTSLLGFLENIDTQKFSVTLFFFDSNGPLLDSFRALSNLEIVDLGSEKRVARGKRLHPLAWFVKLFALLVRLFSKKKNVEAQIMSYCNNWFRKKIRGTKFDIAIAFLESDTSIFVSKKIEATKKLAWVHVDYEKAGFLPVFDRKLYRSFNSIVTVSQECKERFVAAFPKTEDRVFYIPNILSQEYVRKMMNQDQKDMGFSTKPILISTCRIDLNHKGLDRAILALSDIKKSGPINFQWYILGDGPDFEIAAKMVDSFNLGDTVFFLGSKNNPFPYYKNASLFFLPSRYEGRPMAVDEALLAGLPCVVTNYSSAREQINDGTNGIIIDNSYSGIHAFLGELNDHKIDLDGLKRGATQSVYSNAEAIERIGQLFDVN